MDSDFGINFIGPASANLGLGHVTRMFADAVIANRCSVAVFDVGAGCGRSGFDLSLQRSFVDKMDDLPHPINVWVLSAFDMPSNGLRICQSPILSKKINAGFVWWELPDLPAEIIEAAHAFDVLIAGSEYVLEVLRQKVSGIPVLLATHPAPIPAGVTGNRQRFGLPDDGVLIYTGFEPHSDPARKNPFSAIEAFTRAFAGRPDARLVIKVNNPTSQGRAAELVQRVHQSAAEDSRILILQESLEYADLLALYASCDIFISLHRSEGLGLVPLEAMRLGKPVVATGWSGNMSYMRHGNSCPVDFRLTPVTEESVSYAPSRVGIASTWAEPDVGHAAAWLRRLVDDPALRARIGMRAAEDAARYDETARRTGFVDELRALLESRSLRPAKDFASIAGTIQQARRQARLEALTPVERLKLRGRESLERNLLWRFRQAQ